MNILLLSSVYRDETMGARDTSTNIVNSFAVEWVKQGHRVVVIHNAHCYPQVVHMLPESIKKKMASKMGFSVADYDAVKEKKYNDKGVLVFRIPIKKYLPHQSPSSSQILKQVNKTISLLKEENFVPDVITGHWASPQMEIISQLKDIYDCPTAVVLHGQGYVENDRFGASKYLKKIDYLGARSMSQAVQIKALLKLDKLPFVCNSGVPDEYIKNYKCGTEKFEHITKWKFAYVGRLVDYKNVDVTIRSLAQIKDFEWEFNILGDGAARNSLEKLCVDLNCSENVHFLGRVSREEVMEVLSDTHVFVMVSTNEIFGLVYLEAMAASCITIASKYGGVDGIIVNNQNGFLSDEGSVDSLTNIIKDIISREKSSLKQLVTQGYYTSNEYSDSKVATRYLNEITK